MVLIFNVQKAASVKIADCINIVFLFFAELNQLIFNIIVNIISS